MCSSVTLELGCVGLRCQALWLKIIRNRGFAGRSARATQDWWKQSNT
jgi:hypothetical protein